MIKSCHIGGRGGVFSSRSKFFSLRVDLLEKERENKKMGELLPLEAYLFTLTFSGEDRRVRVWDLRNGGLLKEFRGHTDTIYSLSFNQENSVLASGI